jgi:drug/metabolite transporter (DMT)-like permease
LKHDRALGFAALATAGALWGTGFVFGKWALTELSVGQMVLMRFAFASLALAPVVWHESRRAPIRIHRGDLPIILAAALFGVPIQFIVQFEGLAHTTVSHASLMVGMLPVLLAVAAAIFAHERLDAIGWVGLLISTAGAALVAFGAADGNADRGATLLGDLLVVGSLLAAVIWILITQTLLQRGYSSVMATAYFVMIGTAMLAVWVVATEGLPPLATLSLRTWGSVAAMGVIATTTTTLLWNWGLARVPASQAGVFVNLEPVVGAMLGVLLFQDSFGRLSIVGGVLIIAAAVIVSRRNPG